MSTYFKPLRRKFGVLTLVIACALGCLMIWTQHTQLNAFGKFIECHYVTEIALLTSSASELVDTVEMPLDFDRIRDELENHFNSNVFYSVGVSFDGHHGARSIKPTHNASSMMYTPSFLGSTLGQGRQILYGQSSIGQRLLVLMIPVPNAPVYRHLEVVFSQDDVEKEMAASDVRGFALTPQPLHYFVMIVALTLVSAYLLLFKPRAKIGTEIAEDRQR